MQGTILILDGAATNRIMLKVRLSAGYYRVVQSERLEGTDRIIARSRPDLILAGDNLPDGGIGDICAMRDAAAPGLPLLIVTRENDDAARRTSLRCGADDAMSLPLDDLLLLARIRRLIRERNQAEDLRPRDAMSRVLGLSEAPAPFERPAHVAIVAASEPAGTALGRQLGPALRHRPEVLTLDALHNTQPPGSGHDALLLDLSGAERGPDLQLLSSLRSRSATRHCVVIAVTRTATGAAEALDLGADDVVSADCPPEELRLRLDRHLAVQRRSTQARETLQKGLRAAVRDPLTGLYNRRIALPHLARCAGLAQQTGQPFAVMLADIDHFKSVNDRYGHSAGDAVIAETAQRLSAGLGAGDMLARVGGEEFLIVMEDTDAGDARRTAQQLREAINGRPFSVCGPGHPISVTISIGVVAVTPPDGLIPEGGIPPSLIDMADRALYAAKHRGRDRVSLVTAAA